MDQDKYNNNDDLFSKRVRAGRRRTYFFDVRTTKSNDYYITITESKKRFDDDGYERHKLHLYKEDFNKFLAAMQETVEHVKTDLMPAYDFDQFTRDDDDDYHNSRKADGSSETVERVDANDFSEKKSDPVEEAADELSKAIDEATDTSSIDVSSRDSSDASSDSEPDSGSDSGDTGSIEEAESWD